MTGRYVAGSIRRRPAETIAAALALAVLVAFTAAIGSFVAQTGSRLTRTAATRVPIDWQVQLAAGANPSAVAKAVRSVPGYRGSAEVDYAKVPGLVSSSGGGRRTTGTAYLVTLPRTYSKLAPSQLRPLRGSPTGVQLQQQTAANLSATVGSRIKLLGNKTRLTVNGITDLPNAGTFFQVVGAPAGATPSAPPDNVVLLPKAKFDRLTAGAPVTRQLHVQLDHTGLPNDPAAAADLVRQRADHLASVLAGQVLVGDNLEATLSGAREDALYARLLVLLLAVPGLILAGVVAALVIGLRSERQRRDLALLQLRGATPRRCALLIGLIAGVDGLLGAALGIGAAWLASRLALGASATVSKSWLIAGAVAGLLLSIAVQLVPLTRLRNQQRDVGEDLRDVGSSRTPLPLRLGLDVLLLAGSALVFWLTARGHYQVVVVPEGVPVASVNYAALLAPALAWPGAALLVWRLTALALRRRRRAPASDPAGSLPDLRQHAVRHRRQLVARGATGLAVGLAVTVSAAIFTTTYDQQAHLDVALTVGSDVSVTLPPDSPQSLPVSTATVPGVRAVEQVSHRLAYVGPDLQDLYGVDAATVGRAAPLQDAFTPGSSVHAALAKLAATPDGALLSQETLHDYQLRPGDLIRLRLLNASGHYATVPFHVVGVVTEFATAPLDSFIVTNRQYLATATGRSQVETLLVRTDHPAAVAAAIHSPPGALVNDITAPRVAVPSASGLAAGSLRGLARLTLAFGVLLAAGSAGLVLLVGAIQRRRSLVALGVLGASFRQRARFVWTEARWVLTAGVLGGLATGGLIAAELVKILTGIFDPPPQHPALPGGFITLTVAGVLLTAAGATLAATRHAARIDAARLRDL
ncbi:MAG: ABC transporter permease [Frankiaceae bacterium]|nr:ABC transporter permease [Frankiaceae bacterium]